MPNQESKPSPASVQNPPANKKTASDRTKKKKSKHSEKSADDTSPLISAVQSRTAENEEANVTHYTEKRSKEEKELQQQLEPSENTAKSSKKRKRKDIENSKANEADGNIVANEPKRKKRNRTGFADPRADESLGSQCRKALEYAFTQMNKPSKWKFNKARQNWIIRNVWSTETLPDVYFPLVLQYLSKVQGGSREKLKETAETRLTLTEVSSKSSEKVVSFETPPEATLSKIKPSPGPLIVGPTSTSGTSDPSQIVAIDTNEIMRARARQIIAVLSSSDNA